MDYILRDRYPPNGRILEMVRQTSRSECEGSDRIRLERVALGNFGDAKSVGGGVQELRVDYGPGYRVYFTRRGDVVVILLCGGDKRTQDADIKQARELAKEL